MSREYVYLSFFKEKKIDYIYHAEKKMIMFPCMYCMHSADMCSFTSEWTCSYCRSYGSIIHLIDYSKENSFRRMYLPSKERKSIVQMLKRLSKKYPEEKSLIKVSEKVEELINYYEKTPPSQRT